MSLKTRAARARSRYLKHPTDRGLRYYLTLKAKLGKWDDRYCRYYSVPTGVNAATKRFIMRGFASGLVVTATTNGVHAPGSYHGKHQAADMGLRSGEVGTVTGLKKMERFQRAEYSRRGKTQPLELLGPINAMCVLRGSPTVLGEGSTLETQHDNHVHGAFA